MFKRGAAIFKSGGCDGGGGGSDVVAPKVGARIGGGETVDGAFAPKKKLCIGEFSGGDETANAAFTLKTGGSAGGGGGNPDSQDIRGSLNGDLTKSRTSTLPIVWGAVGLPGEIASVSSAFSAVADASAQVKASS